MNEASINMVLALAEAVGNQVNRAALLADLMRIEARFKQQNQVTSAKGVRLMCMVINISR
jgi:hypothetical protein